MINGALLRGPVFLLDYGLVNRSRLVHNDGVEERHLNPCRRHVCHACCVDTRMTLTERDVACLDDAGHSDYYTMTSNGDLRLRNRGGSCVFLIGEDCRAYEARPEGCRLYPLVLDLDEDRVVQDEFCPHRGEFPVDPASIKKLRSSVARETTEAMERRRHASG